MDVNGNRANTFFENDSRHSPASADATQTRKQHGRSNRGMTGEGELPGRSEDSHPRRIRGIVRRIYENRLGEIELARDWKKQIFRDTRGVGDHRERIAFQRCLRKYIERVEAKAPLQGLVASDIGRRCSAAIHSRTFRSRMSSGTAPCRNTSSWKRRTSNRSPNERSDSLRSSRIFNSPSL